MMSMSPLLPHRLLLFARATLLATPWILHLLLADVALSALLPFSVLCPSLCYDAASHIAASVWRGIQSIFTRRNRASIVVSGSHALRPGESAIVVSNHVGWTDFYMIQELALRAGMLGRCRWFAKEQLKWVPFLGWGLWAMGMPLVSRRWTEDQREMERVFQGVVQRRWPIWLISYSEATRFTASKRLAAEEWCSANNRRLGDHVLYPRTKGFVACVQQLRRTSHVRAVHDVTIAYAKNGKLFQSPPSFSQTLSLPRLDRDWRFYVHVERHALEDLPHEEKELATWLEERWLDKGRLLEGLNQKLLRGETWEPLS